MFLSFLSSFHYMFFKLIWYETNCSSMFFAICFPFFFVSSSEFTLESGADFLSNTTTNRRVNRLRDACLTEKEHVYMYVCERDGDISEKEDNITFSSDANFWSISIYHNDYKTKMHSRDEFFFGKGCRRVQLPWFTVLPWNTIACIDTFLRLKRSPPTRLSHTCSHLSTTASIDGLYRSYNFFEAIYTRECTMYE